MSFGQGKPEDSCCQQGSGKTEKSQPQTTRPRDRFERRITPGLGCLFETNPIDAVHLLQSLQFLAGFEAHRLTWGDGYFGTRTGISTNPGLARSHVKNAKSA